jgi:hypothetical protein
MEQHCSVLELNKILYYNQICNVSVPMNDYSINVLTTNLLNWLVYIMLTLLINVLKTKAPVYFLHPQMLNWL